MFQQYCPFCFKILCTQSLHFKDLVTQGHIKVPVQPCVMFGSHVTFEVRYVEDSDNETVMSSQYVPIELAFRVAKLCLEKQYKLIEILVPFNPS